MKIKTTSESTNVLETFKRAWRELGQPYPWRDPKILTERRRIAALDRERIDLRFVYPQDEYLVDQPETKVRKQNATRTVTKTD